MVKFSYLERGNSSHPIIIFLHGFMGEKEDWLPIIENLKKDYYCLALDLPGHGQTPLGNSQNFNQMITQLGHFFEEKLTQQKANLVGYSLGGRVALGLIINYASLFNRVILESCNPGIKNEEDRSKRFQRDQKLFDELDGLSKEQFLDNWFSMPLFGDLKKHPDFKQMQSRRMQGNFTNWKKSLAFLSVGSQENYWRELTQIQTPTLYITGKEDKKYSQLAHSIQNSLISKKIVDGCGHNTHFEKRLEFIQLLVDFFGQQKRAYDRP